MSRFIDDARSQYCALLIAPACTHHHPAKQTNELLLAKASKSIHNFSTGVAEDALRRPSRGT